MRLVQQHRRRSVARRKLGRLPGLRCEVQHLEPRRLLSGETVQSAISPVLASTGDPSGNSITLQSHFFDSDVPGTLVEFETTEGNVIVSLTDAATPKTVANFLTYVNNASGDNYDGTFFHRSVDLTTNIGGSPSAPATIIQGGGYSIQNGSIGHITTASPVDDEYQSEILKDTTGTLAMAKTSAPDSATSEWYFNVSDNTELDTPTTVDGVQTSYTVFGTVLSGMGVVDAIAALPTTDNISGLTNVPVTGLTETQLAANPTINENNLIFTNTVTTESVATYTAKSDNTKLVTPTITNGVLSFAYGAGMSGVADITVTAKNNWDATTTSTTFAVTVPNAATPTAGPVAVGITAPFTVTGTTGTFPVIGSDTDSVAAIDPSTVTIVTQPANGTASVNTSTGEINYTPNTGYTGADSLTYTVADTAGTVSNAATVTLYAAPAAPKIMIGGAGNPKALVFTLPDGVVGHLSIRGDQSYATVQFTDYRVTVSTRAGVAYASGAGATIASLTTGDSGPDVQFSLSSTGPVTIDSVNASAVAYFNAPNLTIDGDSNFFAVGVLKIAALDNATLTILTGNYLIPELMINNVVNSSVIDTGNTIGLIKSKQWVSNDSGTHNVSAGSIESLQISGTFDENLALTSTTRYNLETASVSAPSGTWDLAGSVFRASVGTPVSTWAVSCNGLISSMNIKGNFTNQITAAAITSFTVGGTTSGAVIQTDATFSAKFNQIQHISFAKAVTNTVVFSAGNIGSISAPSFTDSRVYAGVELAEAQSGTLATSASNLSNDAKITSFSLGSGASAFSDSLINADIIGSLHLGKIASSDSGNVEGVAAHSIGSITGTLVPGGVIRAGPAQLKTAATLTAYETKEKLALGDFQIDLF